MADTTPLEVSDVSAWDRETDVVVVGLGAAGASTSLEAAASGADVLVFEGAGGGGGTSAMSGGLIYLGGGTSVQRECGFEDSPENMFAFLLAASGPDPDQAKIRAYCDESVAHYDWLVDQGVPFKAEFYPEPGMEPPTDAGLVYSGGEDAFPFDRLATPAPRAHKPQAPDAAGGFFMECLLAAVERAHIDVEYDTKVRRLVVDESRAVVGVEAVCAGKTSRVGARGGVVLCAGGFVHDDEMVDQHCPQLKRCSLRLGNDLDRGSGIRMGQALGAAVRRMSAAEVAVPLTPPFDLMRGIIVNGQGQRFINEDTYYGRVGQQCLFHEDGQMYLIVDEQMYQPTRIGQQAEWVCETVGELEEEIGLPSGSLETTLELYNRHAVEGDDPLFHKRADYLRPLEPPLGAFDFTVENAIFATFTLGGLDTLTTGEVLTVDREPIPGLFAAGRTTAGIAAFGYASGISLADSTFFGRKAGRTAAGRATAANS